MQIKGQKEFEGEKPPVQLIAMGCPGSGKSHSLESFATVHPDFLFRTTFHPELSYGDFVGAYKPVPVYVSSAAPTYNADGTSVEGHLKGKVPVVKYEYRPGPFINAYIAALLNPNNDVVLLIEEINRANPAAVFGDILQLLDRGEDGSSDYGIDTPDDLRTFLTAQLADGGSNDPVGEAKKLKLPGRLYIWGTMNRADESVNYIDAAFLRRWSLLYLPYNLICNYGKEPISVRGTQVPWDEFRHKLNERLESIGGIDDDKFIGPYFLKRQELSDKRRVFSKLITYLWHDVVPMERDQLFTGTSLSALHDRWMRGDEVLRL